MSDQSPPDVSLAEPEDAIEALWARSGEAPDLERILSDNPHWSPHELRRVLLVDQQFRCRTPQSWSTEDYLAMVPSLAAEDDLTLDLIYGECRERSRQGDAPNLEELVRRFPHLRQRLEQQMEIASWFESADATDSQLGEDDSTGETDTGTIRFGDYELCEEIARGGMGVIYRARHRSLKRTVALKMIRPERLMHAADLRRFKNETQIIARLDHPNIIPILHVDQVDGFHFFTMRMVKGRDLEWRRSEYLGDVRLAARLVSTVAAAIHYAHQHGVLHRDLKPSNILVDDTGVPFVVDFGLARHLSEVSDLTRTDEFLGTPTYAAPELLQEDSQPPNVAADVYGLGAILYVLITGQPPFTGRNAIELWNKIRHSEPRPPRTLNARIESDLEAICLKALEKDPAGRYSSAAALAEDLDHYLAGEAVVARPVGWWQRRGRWLRKYPVRAVLGLIGVVAAVSLLAVIAVQSIVFHRDEFTRDGAVTVQQRQPILAKQRRAIAFSQDGRWLAFTDAENVVLWDWPERRRARMLTGHSSAVTSLAFSPDSRTLATAGNDRRIKLWEPAPGRLLYTITADMGDTRAITFVNNDRLVSVCEFGNLHVWHVPASVRNDQFRKSSLPAVRLRPILR